MATTPEERIKKAILDGKIIDDQTLAVFEMVEEVKDDVVKLETKFDETVKEIKAGVPDLNKVLEAVKGTPGKPGPKGDKPVAGVDYKLPENGKDYVLTETDKKEIAKSITVPVVEKVIEKTEVVKEQPIVKEITKEVAMTDTPEQTRDKIESLQGDERVDMSAIKGLDEAIKKTTGPTSIFGGRPLTIKALGVVIDKNARVINFTGAGLSSVSRSKDGVITVNIGGATVGTPVAEEVPTDSGDHLNFTLAHIPLAGTFRLYRGGSRQQSVGATPDYTLAGVNLVLNVALDTANNEVLFADYSY